MVLEYLSENSLLQLVAEFVTLDERIAKFYMREIVETLKFIDSNQRCH